MDKVKAMLQELREEWFDEETIISAFYRSQSISSEDVVLAKEYNQAVVEVYEILSKALKAEELELLCRYVIDNAPYCSIGYVDSDSSSEHSAKELRKIKNTATQRGKRIIQRIMKKARNIEYPRSLREILLDNPSDRVAKPPRIEPGWLSIYYQNANIGAYWRYNSHRKCKEYTPLTQCRIPEYLQESFKNIDGKTPVCSMCGKRCRRKKFKIKRMKKSEFIRIIKERKHI